MNFKFTKSPRAWTKGLDFKIQNYYSDIFQIFANSITTYWRYQWVVHNKDEVLPTPFFLSSDHDDDFNSAGKVIKYLYRLIIDSVGLAGKEIL